MSKNLLIITPGFPKDELDDTCVPALQIYVKALSASGCFDNVMVVSIYYPLSSKTYFWHSIKIVALGHSQSTFLSRAFSSFQIFPRVSKFVKDFSPNVIHTFWINQTAIIGSMLSRKFDIPHIATMMGQDVFFTKKLRYLTASKKMNLIAVSEFQKEKSRCKVDKVIHWGVEERQEVKTNDIRSIDVIGVGSLIKLKQFDLFLEVIDMARKVKPDIKAMIVGDGPKRGMLLDQIKRLMLEENVKLIGQKSRVEVLSLMRQSKVLLHTSRFESFGMVFVEALNAGMYTLSERVGIAGQHTKSIVVSGRDEMAEKLVLLVDKEVVALPSKVVFSIEETVQRYLECYNSV
ncbi:MAG: glycosyltransferase involved in cell wall biosynthesis [Candidatus Endobugula sp.]|jgi:glycosyltransferase involved in cell wall biosynthesis